MLEIAYRGNPPVGDLSSMPGSRRSLGEGNGNSLQYFCLGNPMDRGACQATVHRVAKSWTRLMTNHSIRLKGASYLLQNFLESVDIQLATVVLIGTNRIVNI